jgi:hypothetical protein
MSTTSALLVVYVLYGTAAVALIVWLARTLFRNGQVFLDDVFEERPEMAHAVNRLLVIGFYMLNLGYAFLLLPGERPEDAVAASELLIRKFGILLVSLGVIHFLNMYVFWKIRQRRQIGGAPPPVMHRGVLEGYEPQT